MKKRVLYSIGILNVLTLLASCSSEESRDGSAPQNGSSSAAQTSQIRLEPPIDRPVIMGVDEKIRHLNALSIEPEVDVQNYAERVLSLTVETQEYTVDQVRAITRLLVRIVLLSRNSRVLTEVYLKTVIQSIFLQESSHFDEGAAALAALLPNEVVAEVLNMNPSAEGDNLVLQTYHYGTLALARGDAEVSALKSLAQCSEQQHLTICTEAMNTEVFQ